MGAPSHGWILCHGSVSPNHPVSVSPVGYLIIGGGGVFSLVFKLCSFMTETSAC